MSRPAPRLRVWVVTPELHREGATEGCVSEQVERWQHRFDLSLYTMRTHGVDLSHVRVRRVWRPRGPHVTRYLWWLAAGRLARWWDAARGVPPDVVYSPGVNGLDADAVSVHIVFAKHWRQVRHGVRGQFARLAHWPRTLHRLVYWWMVRRLERRLYSGPALLWALSPVDAREIEATFARPPGSVPVVPYGVDASAFSPHLRAARRAAARAALGVGDQRVLLLVGNDWHKKGLPTALRALARLDDDCVLLVAGGDDPSHYTSAASAPGVNGRVRFLGHVLDIMGCYAAADCLVAPSAEDAFHLPVLEALAAGLPVVVSATAGVTSLLHGSTEALILDDANDDAGLARLVQRVWEEPAQTLARTVAARALGERMTWDEHCETSARLVERSASTPRVLVLATDPDGVGGIQRVTRGMLEALAALFGGERVSLLAVRDGSGSAEVRGVRRSSIAPAQPTSRVTAWQRAVFALRAVRIARRWQGPNLVILATHAHLAPIAWMCRVASGAPYVVWCHGREAWGRPGLAVRAALYRAARLLTGSEFTAARVASGSAVPRTRICTLRYPLRTLAHAVRSPGGDGCGRRVLTVARLDRADAYKGVDLLLLSWPQVLRRVPDAELMVVGDGDDRRRIEALVRLFGIEATVRFAGHVDDAALGEAYASASVFALPGRVREGAVPEGEGFGLVFVEAAAFGIPCVAGRAGGAAEAVVDGQTGLLVDPDSARDVADAIVRLLEDPVLAARMGGAGRRRALDEFSMAGFRDGMQRLLGELIPETTRT